MVTRMDPQKNYFRIEDTGLDIEIILTIQDEKEGLKDFDKADAVKFLDQELQLQMNKGPHLVCGDTGSDVPMIEAAMASCADTWSIFVTTKEDLASKVVRTCPNSLVVPEPDILISILGLVSNIQ